MKKGIIKYSDVLKSDQIYRAVALGKKLAKAMNDEGVDGFREVFFDAIENGLGSYTLDAAYETFGLQHWWNDGTMNLRPTSDLIGVVSRLPLRRKHFWPILGEGWDDKGHYYYVDNIQYIRSR